jgi:hypothetical protein
MITVAKERIAEAMNLLEQASETENRIQIVGLIDCAKDELSAALKEAKQREGFKKHREIKGQEKLPLTSEGRRRRKITPETGTVAGDGVVVTAGDSSSSDDEAKPEAPITNPDRCDYVSAFGDHCTLAAFHDGLHDTARKPFSDGLPAEEDLPAEVPAPV